MKAPQLKLLIARSCDAGGPHALLHPQVSRFGLNSVQEEGRHPHPHHYLHFYLYDIVIWLQFSLHSALRTEAPRGEFNDYFI